MKAAEVTDDRSRALQNRAAGRRAAGVGAGWSPPAAAAAHSKYLMDGLVLVLIGAKIIWNFGPSESA
ncbi:hypothetical protein CN211_24485 [Sinorhizobium meliloti]|nr:hypothetical protein CN211_24485 [Sinorhizobium meliloti]